jgi:peptidoglycan/xylan/chitin deacetylase (PgdA/CDA1 family)
VRDPDAGPGRAAIVRALALHPLPGLATSVPALRGPLGIADRIADARAVALTFDDGPHPAGTPAILDILAGRGVLATFFLAGEQVERRPALARRVADAGHAVALHCHRHRHCLARGPREFEADLVRGLATLAEATGVRPTRYRPPFGVFSASALTLARRHGLEPTLWMRWGRDWEGRATAASIARLVTRRVRGGDILLLHDADWYSAPGSHLRTAAALPLVLAELERRGLAVAPLGRR